MCDLIPQRLYCYDVGFCKAPLYLFEVSIFIAKQISFNVLTSTPLLILFLSLLLLPPPPFVLQSKENITLGPLIEILKSTPTRCV